MDANKFARRMSSGLLLIAGLTLLGLLTDNAGQSQVLITKSGKGRLETAGRSVSGAVQASPTSIQNGLSNWDLSAIASAECGGFVYTFDGDHVGAYFGTVVSSAGDVNNDGFSDFIIGEPAYDEDTLDQGAAFVLSGLDGTVIYKFVGESAYDGLGGSVSGAGDANGDGFDDVIVGAQGYGDPSTGRAYVFSGQTGDTLYTFTGVQNQLLGNSVSGAGDVDSNGFDDIIIAGEGFQAPHEVYVYSGLDGQIIHTFTRPELGGFGGSLNGTGVSGAGDVNGDGFSDLIVGSRGGQPGRAYVYSGKTGSLLLTFVGEELYDLFGNSVAGAGDVNGDGLDDLIVGAYKNSTAGNWAGRAYVFYGDSIPSTTSAANADLIFTAESDEDQFGYCVSGAGDLDRDGFADLLIGAPVAGVDPFQLGPGRAYVYSGRTGELMYTYTAEGIDDKFGQSVSEADVVSNDDFTEIIIGAPRHAGNLGRAYVYSLYSPACGTSWISWNRSPLRVYLDAVGVCHVEVVECFRDPVTDLCDFFFYHQAVDLFFMLDSTCIETGNIDSVKLVPAGLTGHVFELQKLSDTGWALYFLVTDSVAPDNYHLAIHYDDASTDTILCVLTFENDPSTTNLSGQINVGGVKSGSYLEGVQSPGAPVVNAEVTLWKDIFFGFMFQPADTSEIFPPTNPQYTNVDGSYGWQVPDGTYYLEVRALAFDSIATTDTITIPPDSTIDTTLNPLIADTTPPELDASYVDDGDSAYFSLAVNDSGVGIAAVLFLFDSLAVLENLAPVPSEFSHGTDSVEIVLRVIDMLQSASFHVKAVDLYGNVEVDSFSSPGSSCCDSIRGNVDGDPSDQVNVADLTYLVDYLFRGGPPPLCQEEGDVNGDGNINVADLTYLVDFLFRGGPPPPSCP